MNMFGLSSGTNKTLTGVRKLPFNPATPLKLFVDINSCFATVEQQYNPNLRGKPVAVAAYTGPSGCIVAPSIEAKQLGIKTGMLVKQATEIYPQITVIEPDPPKYRTVHKKLHKVLRAYTPKVIPRSIDEFCIDIANTPAQKTGAIETAKSIKQHITTEVGDWITVSIGIGPNEFLAKTASNLQKPDGLRQINHRNHQKVFKSLALTDLCGIKAGNASRLATGKIFTVMDLCNADIKHLCTAFNSIEGYYWHLKIRGWDLQQPSPTKTKKSFGNSFAIPGKLAKKEHLAPILHKLTQKTAARLRKEGYKARSFRLNITYKDGTSWKSHKNTKKYLDQSAQIYRTMFTLLTECPHQKPVKNLAETCFNLAKTSTTQLEIFDSLPENRKTQALENVMDQINSKYGDMTIKPAQLLEAEDFADDRISFGK
jgi:DNA polymerase IV